MNPRVVVVVVWGLGNGCLHVVSGHVSPGLGLDDLVAHPLLRCNGQLGPGEEWILDFLCRGETTKEGESSILLFRLRTSKHMLSVAHTVLRSLILLWEFRVVFKILNAAVLGSVAKRARVWRVAV